MMIRNYRWLIVGLLFVATTINYLDRQVIGLLKPSLEAEFGWTETDFAHIVMAFTAAYAVGLLLFGRVIDWVGTKWGYTISVAIWSIAGMLHAIARNVGGFMAARIGLGIGEAGNFPAAVKAVSEWFPNKERALATGIFNAGTSIGVVTALFLTPWILSHYRWQEVFWITGALGIIWLLFWWWLYDIPVRQKRVTEQELSFIQAGQDSTRPHETPVSWIKLFSFPQTWAVIVGKLFIDPIYWFFLFWLPSYFSSTFALDLTKPSPELMVIYGATTIGSIGGGYLSSLLVKRGWTVLKARKTALLIFGVLEISIILAQFASSVWMAVALISLAVAVHQAWATNIFTLASDLFPKTMVSSVVGISGMAGAIGGILFPMLVGYLLDSYKLHDNLTGGYNLLFTICGCTYLFVLWMIHLLTRRRRKLPI
ncbi:MFS transporter [Parapedobacter indicus]|uniref:MFS transporter, ACS family, hexuronate transporter n=1 Tax=Parapedobacter indicus TaxID=1477437 RepID=A0A1I3FDR1_9SPHI|nr:MFS transporter [Parapedobacter indicus]PPL03672.1 ACS family hexuronate transporter-like MFS transporter [Parapedobacter indicus]SFI09310.1 MFS transporter, ACS family, hexuronate transporter [Parapedobacter indicus]